MTSTRIDSVSRRTIRQTALGTGLVTGGIGGTGLAVAADRQVERPDGLASLYHFGAFALHNCMAPGTHTAVTTQIIEPPNELHIIDTRMVQGLVKDARDYADFLGKRIAGVISVLRGTKPAAVCYRPL